MNWLIGKDPDAGKDWSQEDKGTTEDEMVGWHHWLDGHEFEQTPGFGDGEVLQSMGSQRVRHNWATELKHQSTYSAHSLKTRSILNIPSLLLLDVPRSPGVKFSPVRILEPWSSALVFWLPVSLAQRLLKACPGSLHWNCAHTLSLSPSSHSTGAAGS